MRASCERQLDVQVLGCCVRVEFSTEIPKLQRDLELLLLLKKKNSNKIPTGFWSYYY